MSALLPPAERVWWNQPVDRVEIVWIAIALVWCLIMFFMMPWWHVYGEQNYKGEAYRITPEAYVAKVNDMVSQYQVGTDGNRGHAVVAPPAGSDVYLLARLWDWYPVLQLKKGETYRLHLSSADWQHGFSLQPLNINVQVLPGYDMVMTITPTSSGEFGIVCNEYCGILHHTMIGKMIVLD
jgi:cytochrome c oxidase subunit II